jgi:uncharacterized membrane protein
MDDIAIARALHVVAVLHWIGGLAFVTLVVLPTIAAVAEPARRLVLFEAVERRFSGQVKLSVPLAGASGAYMAERLDLWNRFVDSAGWWLAAMALLWLLFMAILFVIEPLLLHSRFRARAAIDLEGAFRLIQRLHWLLLAIAAVVVTAGVLGAHGQLG